MKKFGDWNREGLLKFELEFGSNYGGYSQGFEYIDIDQESFMDV